ncbi:hypothetical protein V8C44DRAFT_221944 [Trichoderma aethiopicum]
MCSIDGIIIIFIIIISSSSSTIRRLSTRNQPLMPTHPTHQDHYYLVPPFSTLFVAHPSPSPSNLFIKSVLPLLLTLEKPHTHLTCTTPSQEKPKLRHRQNRITNSLKPFNHPLQASPSPIAFSSGVHVATGLPLHLLKPNRHRGSLTPAPCSLSLSCLSCLLAYNTPQPASPSVRPGRCT